MKNKQYIIFRHSVPRTYREYMCENGDGVTYWSTNYDKAQKFLNRGSVRTQLFNLSLASINKNLKKYNYNYASTNNIKPEHFHKNMTSAIKIMSNI